MSKKKIHTILGRTLLLLLVGCAGMLLLGAERTKKEKLCSGIDIQVGLTDQKGFIDEKEIAGQVKGVIHGQPVGTPVKNFDLRKIESQLEHDVWIKKAQMFFDNNEILHVQVEQRIPVARIMESSGASYYFDSTGYRLPLSNSDRADVPVFTNVPAKYTPALAHTLVNIAGCISRDSFLLAQVAQVNVLSANRFELFPAFGKHVVDLGDGSDMADKLERLKQFYKTVLVRKGFDEYPTISLAFKRRVLAIKADSGTQRMDAGKAMQVFDQIVKTNRRTANEDADNNAKKERVIKDVTEKETVQRAINEQPPDIKNKGNPVGNNSVKQTGNASPKAVMPKSSHN